MPRPLLPSLLAFGLLLGASPARSQTLPGTKPWPDRGDPASAMVEGLHRFADRLTASSVEQRKTRWTIDTSSPEACAKSIEPNRQRFERIIGAVGQRVSPAELSYVSSPDSPAKIAEAGGATIFAVRWGVYPGVEAEGLLLVPEGEIRADVVALPDCSSSPEAFVGLVQSTENGLAFHLARQGCRILIPTLVDRTDEFSGNPSVRTTNLSHREWIYRMAYETGRHLIGYEVDEVRAAVDWFKQTGSPGRPIGVVGHGEGGLIALYSAAVDTRIDGAWVAGYYGPREQVWHEPIDRNVWSLLTEFGDAEIGALVVPRSLIVEICQAPEVAGPPRPRNGRNDAASGVVTTPRPDAVVNEWGRINDVVSKEALPRFFPAAAGSGYSLVAPEKPEGVDANRIASGYLLKALGIKHRPLDEAPTLRDLRPSFNPRSRMKRLVEGWVNYTQGVIRTSELRRYAYWSKTDTTSPEAWTKSIEPYRKAFHEELIGKLPGPAGTPEARTVQLYDEPKWVGYAVELPIVTDVVASGILLLPKDLKPGEKRPVVVCQHGLEGRPEAVCDPKNQSVYRSFGAQLADRGYIVYAPQNPYIGHDRFRTLQRKLNPLQQSLFSVIVLQHDQTLQWLAARPEVDPARIAFYGLSYGGKTAMRVPAILPGYCLSICSGDFNEWVVKNTNLDRPLSYMYTLEYDMYEFGLAERFNYAEMAALIAPRPFMVERGHKDGVAPDEWIGYEFAKVKRTYDFLNLSDRVEIAYFNDGHRIDGAGTFPFLAKHLNWPRGK
jgi:dienelactone hydrolase